MNSTIDYSCSDRFIPLRGSSFDSLQVSHTYPKSLNISCKQYSQNYMTENSVGNMNHMQQLHKTNQYRNMLVKTMFLSPRRVLYFSPKQKSTRRYLTNDFCVIDESWPVKARRQPLLTNTPDLILDVPESVVPVLGNTQRVDWGATGYIATIHRNSIHTHNPDTNARNVIQLQEPIGDFIKWDNQGVCLAIAIKDRIVGVWDMNAEKVTRVSTWRPSYGDISCMIYTSRLFITGHSKGILQIWTHNLERSGKTIKAHEKTILTMKVSCNERYLATSGMEGSVKIWTLPTCIDLIIINCEDIIGIHALDWHPWKESILVLGKPSKESFCTVWNITNPANMELEKHPNNVFVDCVTFNPISAELVISFSLHRTESSETCQNIVVQSSLTKIVDDINFHSTRTPYLLWDKPGRRLATVGADENLAIWNFFGTEQKKITPVKLFKERSFLEAVLR